MKTVLVTGAAGFIGSHLVESALDGGWSVIGLDNLDDYYDPARKVSNVKHALGRSEYEFVEGDIRNERFISELMRGHGFDAVAHFAGIPGVRHSLVEPLRYTDVNVQGTIALLQTAAGLDQRPRFVVAGSSSVYGNTTRFPFEESDPCDMPLAPYPASKRAVELMGHAYHHVHGIDFTSLRLFTVYGPRNRPDMMAYKLTKAALNGTAVEMNAGGAMSRDLTYVADIVTGTVAALDKSLGYEVINLGSGKSTSVSELKTIVEEATGKQIASVNAPAPRTDATETRADIARAGRLLGYSPRTSLEDGVAALVDWLAE